MIRKGPKTKNKYNSSKPSEQDFIKKKCKRKKYTVIYLDRRTKAKRYLATQTTRITI